MRAAIIGGRVSIKYMRMNPAMSARPTYACGLYKEWLSSSSESESSWSSCRSERLWWEVMEYSVSMPSGMITMRDVPTRTPMPRVEIRRRWGLVSVRVRGSMPAPKEL